jgi:hypothetical protein
LAGETPASNSRSSIWSRDITASGRGQPDNWFPSNICCRVGNGNNVGFWKFKWFGNQPLCHLFPGLYAKETGKDVVIAARMGSQVTRPSWSWNWSEGLNEVDEQQVASLKALFADFMLQPATADSWRWVSDTNGMFSVKSCYSLLLTFRQLAELDEDLLMALRKLWKSDIPSKVKVFGWRLLLKKLPTRAALSRRGILDNQHDLRCVFCSLSIEDTTHLFFSCPFIQGV